MQTFQIPNAPDVHVNYHDLLGDFMFEVVRNADNVTLLSVRTTEGVCVTVHEAFANGMLTSEERELILTSITREAVKHAGKSRSLKLTFEVSPIQTFPFMAHLLMNSTYKLRDLF